MNDALDFEQFGGRLREKAVAVLMRTVVSDAEQGVTVGASSDC